MNRWRIVTAALAVVTLAAALVAGGASASAHRTAKAAKFDPTCGPARAKQRTVDGTLGSMEISGTPKRIVALEFSFVDDLVAVGLKPIGIADDNNPSSLIPPVKAAVGSYTSVGLRATPNLETIASLHPDLIIADAGRHAKIYDKLQAIARLDTQARALEARANGPSFAEIVARERAHSPAFGGRSVSGSARRPRAAQPAAAAQLRLPGMRRRG